MDLLLINKTAQALATFLVNKKNTVTKTHFSVLKGLCACVSLKFHEVPMIEQRYY